MVNSDQVNLLLKFTLGFITLSLAFGIRKNEILGVFKQPKILLLGLGTQIILLPILAFIICLAFPLPPLLKLGIMIIALCPGGTTANLLSYLYKAKVGLSISLTAINGLLCLFSIPLLINLFDHVFIKDSVPLLIPYGQIIFDLFMVIIIPGITGVILNGQFPKVARNIQSSLRFILPVLLGVVFGIKLFAAPEQGGLSISLADINKLILPLLLLNLSSILVSYFISARYTQDKKISITIAIETGLQNTALALLIASSTGLIELQKPAVIYAAFSFFSTALFVFLVQKKYPLK